MKHYIATIAASAALIIVIFGAQSFAQRPVRVVATIPFDFHVGDQTLPAGRYEFSNLNRQAQPGMIVIRATERADNSAVIVAAQPNEANRGDAVGLVFTRYGGIHFLSRIDLHSSDLAVRFGKTSTERRIAKEMSRPVAVLIRP